MTVEKSVTLNEYQTEARKTAVYPDSSCVIYPAMAMAEEAGEVAGKVAKAIRKHGLSLVESTVDRDGLVKECGDVLWQLANLVSDLGVSLEYVARVNLAKLADRAERGVLKGEGDNR